MTINVSYGEINSFITSKAQQPLNISYAHSNNVKVRYTYKKKVILIGEVQQDVDVYLSVYSVSSDTIVLKADSGALVNLVLPMVLNAIAGKNNLNFRSASGDKITVQVSKIPGASAVLQNFNLQGVNITNSGIDVSVKIK